MAKAKKQKNVLGIYYNEDRSGDTEFFFAGDTIISYLAGDDGQYRDEYMNCLFEHFGIQVKRLKKLNAKQEKAYVKYCKEYDLFGYEDESYDE